jgi:hypothetical protein
MCQDRHPPPPPPSCLSQKTRMPSPRRQHPLYQGSLASCTIHPVRLRPSRSRPSSFATSPNAVRAGAMRRDVRSRSGWLPARGTRSLVDRSLPAGGRHPHFFRSRMVAARRGSPPRHSIHLIAIRRRRPWLESRVEALAREIADAKPLAIEPNCAARTVRADVQPIVDVSQRVGIAIEAPPSSARPPSASTPKTGRWTGCCAPPRTP